MQKDAGVAWKAAAWAAALVLAGAGIGQAVRAVLPAWRALLLAPPAAASTSEAARRPAELLAPVEAASQQQLQAALRQLPADSVVLDLRALESLEAGLELVRSRLEQGAAAERLVCWLAPAPEDLPALADAVRQLSREGCRAVRVALPGGSEAGAGAAADARLAIAQPRPGPGPGLPTRD